YLLHFLLFFSYVAVRASAASVLSPDVAHRLLRREVQVIFAFLVFSVVKLVKENSTEASMADILFYAKAFLFAIAFYLDYYLALWYALAFFVIYVVTQQPPYEGLGTAVKLTPLQLESVLTESSTSRFWLIEFRALNSYECLRTSRFIPELSITYSNKNLSFGIVDLGLFPNAAEKFGISLSGGMSELPTYILFENAVEVTRFPEFSSVVNPPITKGLLCHHFELDLRLLEYVNGK
uniref:Thioredoxin-related transmembrane protein 2 n=1 Tax=Kalanchoe fedtschenkoi TaxID=63787 RepID=A0A7N0RHK6_KALFE